jgi:hypothetical protein
MLRRRGGRRGRFLGGRSRVLDFFCLGNESQVMMTMPIRMICISNWNNALSMSMVRRRRGSQNKSTHLMQYVNTGHAGMIMYRIIDGTTTLRSTWPSPTTDRT